MANSAAAPTLRPKKPCSKKVQIRAVCFGRVICHKVMRGGVTFLHGMMNLLAAVPILQRIPVVVDQVGTATRYVW